MQVLAKRGSDVAVLTVPKYDSEYAVVDYCINNYGNEFESYQCKDFVRRPNNMIHYLTKDVFNKMSYISYNVIMCKDDNVHSSVITVSSDDNSFIREEIVNGRVVSTTTKEDMNIDDLMRLVHHYQYQGYKIAKGKLSAKRIVDKF
jgi:hypothetical protein